MCSETVLFYSKGYCNVHSKLYEVTPQFGINTNTSGINSGLPSCFGLTLMRELDKLVSHYCSTETKVTAMSNERLYEAILVEVRVRALGAVVQPVDVQYFDR